MAGLETCRNVRWAPEPGVLLLFLAPNPLSCLPDCPSHSHNTEAGSQEIAYGPFRDRSVRVQGAKRGGRVLACGPVAPCMTDESQPTTSNPTLPILLSWPCWPCSLSLILQPPPAAIRSHVWKRFCLFSTLLPPSALPVLLSRRSRRHPAETTASLANTLSRNRFQQDRYSASCSRELERP